MERVVDRPRHAFIPFSIGKRQCMAQEVTFMMLRVLLFEIYKRFQLRLAPGAMVVKNTVVTTKPAAVPVVRAAAPTRTSASGCRPRWANAPAAPDRTIGRDWGTPTEIPQTSAFRHLLIAYGSNFGSNKELAERFAERSRFHGYTNEVLTLNELAQSPPDGTEPWLLAIMTSTYTSNPPSNATAFKSWLEHTEPGTERWRNCRYLVWGLGNSQWNAFLAFPRYIHRKLSELGATPLVEFAYGDVGSPVLGAPAPGVEHAGLAGDARALGRTGDGGGRRGSRPKRPPTGALTRADSNTAMAMSLGPADTAPRVLLVPKILTNTVGVQTIEARVRAVRRTPGATVAKAHAAPGDNASARRRYRAGDHLGVCPKNDEERVERLARRLGAALDGLLTVPETLNVRAVPKGVVLQVRNVLTNLVDIPGCRRSSCSTSCSARPMTRSSGSA